MAVLPDANFSAMKTKGREKSDWDHFDKLTETMMTKWHNPPRLARNTHARTSLNLVTIAFVQSSAI